MPASEPTPPDPAWPRYAPGRKLPPYRYGADLHNFAYWWEAHECWEGLWQLTDKRGEQALFLQGLIQVSAGLLKAHLGSQAGTKVLLGEALRKLEGVAAAHPRYMGLDLNAYAARVRACLDAAQQALPLPAERIPMIRLE